MENAPDPRDFDVPWLSNLLEVPGNAAWPALMSPPHPRAVSSYGEDVERLAWEQRRIRFRWWQRLALRRQFEHDEDGALCWRIVAESAPRRSGKSVRLRESALWRVQQSDRFGEEQLVVLTGKDLPICKEIHRRAWSWALAPEQKSAGWQVRRVNGQEEVAAPDESRWMVRGRDSVYGYDMTYPQVDEGWGVHPSVVDDGLEPATLERVQPQIVLTSTSHRKASALMPGFLETAADDVLRVAWWAPRDADPSDPAGWRAASPHWSAERERLIGGVLQRALTTGQSVDADEPDPIEAIRSQYLNVWPVRGAAAVPLWADPTVWRACVDTALPEVGARPVVGVGLDRVAGVWPVVVAWRDAEGRVLLRLVTLAGSKDAAAEAAKRLRPGALLLPRVLRGQVTVQGARETVHAHGGDVAAAREMVGWMAGQGQLRVDPRALDAVLGSPLRREGDRVDMGTLCVLAAWWAGRDRKIAQVV